MALRAGHAPAQVERWPLAEVLTIYIELETDRQLEQWRYESVLWQIRAAFNKSPGRKPQVPPLVQRRYRS